MILPSTDTLLLAAGALLLLLLTVRVARGGRARPDLRTLAASGAGARRISQHARIAEDVAGLAVYRAGQRSGTRRQNVPAAAPTAVRRQERRSAPIRRISVTV